MLRDAGTRLLLAAKEKVIDNITATAVCESSAFWVLRVLLRRGDGTMRRWS